MKLLFVGDVMLGRLVNQVLKEKAASYPWGDTLDIFKQTDARFCNLECVVSDRGEPWSATPKVFHFRTDEKNIEVLKKGAINAVSLANNHTLDYGYEAMLGMLKILDREKIRHAGAGDNLEKAAQAAIFQIKKVKIGLISFSDNEPSWEAKKNAPGIFFVPIHLEDRRARNLLKLIKKTKASVDLLVVSAHWGPNWGYRPPPHHIPFAHALIDSGADIIHGHSCHVFQGIEIYRSKPIIYSCGDFVDDYAVDEVERNDESGIFVIEAKNSGIYKLIFLPTVIENFQAKLAIGEKAKEIAGKMQRLCAEFGTSSSWNQEKRLLEIDL